MSRISDVTICAARLRCFLVLLVLWQGCLRAEEEVRSYRLNEQDLRKAFWKWTMEPFGEADPFAAEREGDFQGFDEWPGPVVDEAGFESRFLTGAGELRDFTKSLGEMAGRELHAGKAVYDVKNERLIVNAGEKVHDTIRSAGESVISGPLMTELSIYKIPGVDLEARPGIWEEVPEGAELLAGVSCVGLPWVPMQTRTDGGGLVLELEAQLVSNDGWVDNRFTLVADLPTVKFSWATGFASPLGEMWAQEIGSLDGEERIVMVVKQDRMTVKGEFLDEWILKEEGGKFLREERLVKMRRKVLEEETVFEMTQPFQVFEVPLVFETFLVHGEPGWRKIEVAKYPELKELKGDFYSFERLLKENGVSFREGDFVVLKKGSSKVYAKLSKASLELLQMIIKSLEPEMPRMIRVDFTEVAGDDICKGRMLQKAGISLLPGQSGGVKFGGDLFFQVEAQNDANDEEVEMRLTLSEKGGDLKKASLVTGLNLQSGKPVVIQESVVAGRRKRWVATARVVALDEEVALFLKQREGRK